MSSSEYILKCWEREISCYDKLSLEEAKKIYIELKDGNYELREKLITGTLYLIPNFIRNSILPYISGNGYDMNDVISVCNEVWINFIDSGTLLEILYFSRALDYDYYNLVSNKLVSSYDLYNTIGINNMLFCNILCWYINEEINGRTVSYESYLQYINNYVNDSGEKIYNVIPCKNYIDVYNFIKDIYDLLIKNGYGEKNVSYRQIKYLKNILLDNVIENKSKIYNLSTHDYELCDKMIIEEQLINIIFNKFPLKDKEKGIIRCYYGLDDGRMKTAKEIGEIFGITKAGADISIKRTIKKIRKNSGKINDIINCYFDD